MTACGAAAPSGSSGSAAAPSSAPAATIELGVLANLTGPFAPQGAELRLNTELAIKQWNDSGGVNGRKVEAKYVDPKSDPAQALQLATALAQQDQVDALTGAVGSPECLGVAGLAQNSTLCI